MRGKKVKGESHWCSEIETGEGISIETEYVWNPMINYFVIPQLLHFKTLIIKKKKKEQSLKMVTKFRDMQVNQPWKEKKQGSKK